MRTYILARCAAFAAAIFVGGVALAQPVAPAGAPTINAGATKLLDPGAEPRRELRYKPKAGQSHTFLSRVTTKMKIAASGPGAPAMPPMDMPVMEGRTKAEVVSVAPDGAIQIKTTLEDMKAVGGTQAPGMPNMDQMIAQMKGKTSTLTVDAQGNMLGGEGMASPNMALGGGGSESSLQLPAEPIGVGAKWENVVNVSQQGMDMEMRVTSELKRIEGDILDVETRLTGATEHSQAIPAQPGQAAPPPMNMKMDMSGVGSVRVDLANPMPLYQQMMASMKMKMTGGPGGMNMDQTMDMETTSSEQAYGAARAKDLDEAAGLIKQAAAKWNEKDFDGAISAAQKALDLRLKHLPPGHADVEKVEGMIKAATDAKK